MKQCIKRNSKVIKFVVTLIIIGLLAGIILYLNLNSETKESIIKSIDEINKNILISKQNNIVFHLLIISIFILFSLTIILYPLTYFYLFYEVLSFGFVLAFYTKINGIGGLLYSLIYFVLNKALFLLILIYLNVVSFQLIKRIINSILQKDNISVRDLYQNYFLKTIISIGAMLLFDIIIYFFGNKILSIFQFLI